jgi:hypothetical protein
MLVLKFLSSLRLTVALMAMAMVLILAGTLAQVEQGVWTVVGRYFRSVAVVIEPNLFIPEKWVKIPGGIPFPGGLTLGVLLFINLVAAHAATFKLSWKRAGMIVTHLGVLLLLVGEFVTGALAEEGNMSIDEGASANYVEDIRTSELAVIDRSGAAEDAVVAVSQRLLAHGGRIAHAAMPFEVEVVDAQLADPGPQEIDGGAARPRGPGVRDHGGGGGGAARGGGGRGDGGRSLGVRAADEGGPAAGHIPGVGAFQRAAGGRG